jgi:hypothetical protein
VLKEDDSSITVSSGSRVKFEIQQPREVYVDSTCCLRDW